LQTVLAEQGTLVLSVHPGPIKTDMAVDAGLVDIADPPAVVGDGIVTALRAGQYHLFPDTLAQQVGGAYAGFAETVIEADSAEG
jgi:NAD(P)-dependent dehydrogenase (short-subunit alcohol dehydrogenase family)